MSDPAQDLLKKMLEYLEKTESFMVEQTPDFILQLLHYKFLESVLGFIAFLGVGILGFYYGRTFYLMPYKDEKVGIAVYFGTISLMSLLALFLAFVINGAPDFIKIWMAPKLYLVEYVRGML